MSEEKKLTDEELAKALLQSIEYSKTITYFDIWGNCKSIFVTDIIDLIHRLQAENETLKNKKFGMWKVKFFKAQEEIERLTEELETKCKECREIADDYQEMGTFYYNETVKTAELQKQVDELEIVNSNLVKRINRIGRNTAKEIFDEIGKISADNTLHTHTLMFVFNKLKEIVKSKGVEVE